MEKLDLGIMLMDSVRMNGVRMNGVRMDEVRKGNFWKDGVRKDGEVMEEVMEEVPGMDGCDDVAVGWVLMSNN